MKETEEDIHRRYFPIIDPDKFTKLKSKVEYVNKGDSFNYFILWLKENEYTVWDNNENKLKWQSFKKFCHNDIKRFLKLLIKNVQIYNEDDQITLSDINTLYDNYILFKN